MVTFISTIDPNKSTQSFACDGRRFNFINGRFSTSEEKIIEFLDGNFACKRVVVEDEKTTTKKSAKK